MRAEREPWRPGDDQQELEGAIVIGRVRLQVDDHTCVSALEVDGCNGKSMAVWWDRKTNCFRATEIPDVEILT